MSGQLIERQDGEDGRVYPLGPGTTRLGREADNEIVIANQQVSRHHAEVRCDGERYLLHDLGSRNGTFVNGEKLLAPHCLQHGDELGLAGSVLVFHSDETATWSPDAATAPPLRLDLAAAQVWVGERRVRVTAQEYRALVLLYDRRGSLVGKEALLAQVWPDYPGDVAEDSLAQLISRLRRKLEPDPQHPRYIETVRGLGYRLVPQ